MGTTLTGTTPQDTYDSLIKVTDNGPLSGSLKTLTDGLGNDSALALSTGAATITGTLNVAGKIENNAGGIQFPREFRNDFAPNAERADMFFYSNFTSLNSLRIGTIAASGGLTLQGTKADDSSIKTNLVFNPDGGLVGIGTGTPFAELQVNKASDVTLALSNSTAVTSGNRGSWACYNSDASTVALIKATAVTDNVGTQLEFYTRPAAGSLAQTMTIDSTGNVGIGTSTPATTLEVNGEMRSTRSGVNSQYIGISGGDAVGGFITNTGVGKVLTILNSSTGSSDVVFDQTIASTYTFKQAGTQILRIDADGVKFGTDSAAANALDDYEEGTFTPTNAGDATGVVSSPTGTYTKIGNVVTFRAIVVIDSNFTSAAIGGLPYTVAGGGVSSIYGGNAVFNDNSSTLFSTPTAGSTTVLIYSGSNTANLTPPITSMAILRISGTYFVS